jgi:cyclophilin family peptidyl-prolyl cis-trans isomerase
VSHRWNPIVTCLGVAMLAALAGCNRGGDGSPASPANISGQASGTTATGGVASQKPASDPLHPVVLIETSLGNITLRLDADKVRVTVDNFLEYVKANHYDQTIVHQVYKGQGFLGGGYGVNLVERPARTPIWNEAPNGGKNRRGTIAMVRLPDSINSATCQFFINVTDNPALDYRDRTPEGYGYCVFGEVTEGLDVVDKIAAVEVHDTRDFDRTPVQPIVVKSIRRIR